MWGFSNVASKELGDSVKIRMKAKKISQYKMLVRSGLIGPCIGNDVLTDSCKLQRCVGVLQCVQSCCSPAAVKSTRHSQTGIHLARKLLGLWP